MKNPGQERITNGIFYTLFYKNVKNFNLRVRTDGSVVLSVPRRCAAREADAFVASRAAWIGAARERVMADEPQDVVVGAIDRSAAEARFRQVLMRYYPYFCHLLDAPPELLVRDMTSRWGVCHIPKRRITLNLRLAAMPAEALEYVVVHEYAHFAVPNHSAAFWAEVARVLPDWKARRALLRR